MFAQPIPRIFLFHPVNDTVLSILRQFKRTEYVYSLDNQLIRPSLSSIISCNIDILLFHIVILTLKPNSTIRVYVNTFGSEQNYFIFYAYIVIS